MAIGDLNKDGIDDIAVADYNQNLHSFILNEDGTVKYVQTSKINTKPRDITIFDWNNDGYNDILIADGGSGLDIKVNQLKTVAPTTPPVPLLRTKFEYTFVEGTDRIATKTQIDTVVQGIGTTTEQVRKTVSTFNNTTGNLDSIEVIGTDGQTIAETKNIYNLDNIDSTFDLVIDPNGNQTEYTYWCRKVL